MTRLIKYLKFGGLLIAVTSLNASWTLDQTIEYALTHNSDIQMATAAIEAAESKVEQAQSAYRPQINVESSYMRTNLPLNAFGSILNQGVFDFGLDFNNPGEVDNLNLTGSVVYSLYQGGSRSAILNASKYGKSAALERQQVAEQQLKFAIIQTWNQIVQAKDFFESQKSNANALSNSLQIARKQFDAGKFLKTEVLNLEVQLAQANQAVVHAELNLKLTRQSLFNLLGTTESELQGEIEPTAVDLFQGVDFSSIQAKERPELRVAALLLEVAREHVEVAKSSQSPQLNAFANYQYNKGFELNGDGNHWTAGVAVNYNIYSGGLTRSKIKEAKANLKKSERYLEKIKLAIDLEQSSTQIAYSNAIQTVEVTSKMVEQAEESASLYRKRFESGVILSSELIDVENRLTAARMHRAQSRTQLNIAQANLLRALGQL